MPLPRLCVIDVKALRKAIKNTFDMHFYLVLQNAQEEKYYVLYTRIREANIAIAYEEFGYDCCIT